MLKCKSKPFIIINKHYRDQYTFLISLFVSFKYNENSLGYETYTIFDKV